MKLSLLMNTVLPEKKEINGGLISSISGNTYKFYTALFHGKNGAKIRLSVAHVKPYPLHFVKQPYQFMGCRKSSGGWKLNFFVYCGRTQSP